MNIEQTKKMNFMIKELRNNGIVSQMGDAVEMASGMYDNAMPNGKSSDSQANFQNNPSSEEKSPDVYQVIERKLRYARSEHDRMIEEKFRELTVEMQRMKQQYDNQLKELRRQIAAKGSDQRNIDQQSTISDKPVQVEKPQQDSYNPDNVVLENYFYFGKH